MQFPSGYQGLIPLLKTIFIDFKRPFYIIFKFSFLYFYTRAEFLTSDYLRELQRLGACDPQVDTTVRFPSSKQFFGDLQHPIFTIFKAFFLHFYT